MGVTWQNATGKATKDKTRSTIPRVRLDEGCMNISPKERANGSRYPLVGGMG
jgi:hypothetical protein